ncbi:MAG: flavodoxin family protein [bacterium]
MKLLVVNGSPRQGSSTEILAEKVVEGFQSVAPDAEVVSVRLNDLDIIPCQSCGVSPAPTPCLFRDDLYPWLEQLVSADAILIASPIFFDSVSAQTKLFIDRTNCLRPPVFTGKGMTFDTASLPGGRGAYILVGGERQKTDVAERVIGGMFVWLGIEKVGKLTYAHSSSRLGAAEAEPEVLEAAFALGSRLATGATI